MGGVAGTGVRSFAEGGSTSAPSGNSFNLATANQNFARGLVDPSSVTLDTSRPGLGTPQRQIYQAQYADYGLGSTPQAQGRLASILNMGNYGNQMPTFTRPQMTPPPSGGFGGFPMQALSPQPAYRIPYGPSIPQRGMNIPRIFGRPANREQSLQNLARDYQQGNLTEAAYDILMQNPETSLDWIRRVEAGEDLTARTPTPIRYMTAGQQEAYNTKLSNELSGVLTPRTAFDTSNDPGSAGG